jgi:hypothetical protein
MSPQHRRETAGGGEGRWGMRILALLFVAAVLAGPFALINRGFSMLGMSTDETLHTLLRLCALLGISLLFLQMVTGAFRPALRRVFKARTIQGFHAASGVLGLAFVISHFVLMIPSIGEHWANLNHSFFVLGPIVLAVLIITVGTALVLRRTHPAAFSRLHVLNYVVFIVGVVHSTAIGTQGSTVAGRALLALYAVIGLAGLTYRASSAAWRRRLVPVRVSGR